MSCVGRNKHRTLACPFMRRSSSSSTLVAPVCSPAGYEDCYQALRDLRSETKRPVMFLRELARHSPDLAAKLAKRVSFSVPSTKSGALLVFFTRPAALFICGALFITLYGRQCLGQSHPLSSADAIVAAATVIFWVMQEWAIHYYFHSAFDWFGRDIHRWHHELPYYHVSIDHVLLCFAWFSVVGALLIGCGTVFPKALHLCLTALIAYTFSGLVYEGAHFLAHTRVPLPKVLNAIRRHHRRHHVLSEAHWLAFTVPAVDTLLGTSPAPEDVVRARSAPRQDLISAQPSIRIGKAGHRDQSMIRGDARDAATRLSIRSRSGQSGATHCAARQSRQGERLMERPSVSPGRTQRKNV